MSRKAYTNKTVAMELKMRSRKDKTRKVCSQCQKKMKISGQERERKKREEEGGKEKKNKQGYCTLRELNPRPRNFKFSGFC